MKNIAVFFGGCSFEHDVSLITGVLTANSLDKEKYNVFPILVDKCGVWRTGTVLFDLDNYKNLDAFNLQKVAIFSGDNKLYAIKKNKIKELCSIAVAINCMHGENGEDGSLSGALKLSNIPLASPDMLASSVSIDKRFTKILLKGIGVKALPSVFIKNVADISSIKEKLGFPVIVKPTFLGSSIGIKTAKDDKELFSAVLYALKFGDSAIVEPLIEDYIELNCAAYADEKGEVVVSECEMPVRKSEILSFDDKYKCGDRVFPAKIDKAVSDKIKKITEKVYRAIDCSGIVRIDYFLCDKVVYVNEINSVPGSLAYYLFCNTTKEFGALLDKIIAFAERKAARNFSVKREYSSGIICGFGAKGGKNIRPKK